MIWVMRSYDEIDPIILSGNWHYMMTMLIIDKTWLSEASRHILKWRASYQEYSIIDLDALSTNFYWDTNMKYIDL